MTKFEVNGKVALISGGASGMGLNFGRALLNKGAKVALLDLNNLLGKKIAKELQDQFGDDRVIFIQADVANKDQYEDAFRETLNKFINVDILIQCAGIGNDSIWEKELQVNVIGTINGMLLGLENYIQKFKSGQEGLILNISSIFGIWPSAGHPIYSASKFAVHGMTLSWGQPEHYNRTNVRVVGICPGLTDTNMVANLKGSTIFPEYEEFMELLNVEKFSKQSAEDCVKHAMKVIEKAPNGTMWVVEDGKEAYQYIMPDRFEIPRIHL